MDRDALFHLLDQFHLEIPSWAFGDSGRQIGKFFQPGAAVTIEEKLQDAGVVNKYTGCCPTVAVNVQWDFSVGTNAADTAQLARKQSVSIGSIHPNFFQDQLYRFGSVCSSDENAQAHAHRHMMESIAIAKAVKSNTINLWFPDGTAEAGQDDITERKHRMHGALRQWHDALPAGMIMLLQCSPADASPYHSDIADWGMAYIFAKDAGDKAKVFIDSAHPRTSENIEQIVSFLLDEEMLGGLRLCGSKAFQIFCEIRNAVEMHDRNLTGILYQIGEPSSLKPKIEAIIQNVLAAQESYLKACLVDRVKLRDAHASRNIIEAQCCLQTAFETDVKPMLSQWRKKRNLDPDPLSAYRASGYHDRGVREREPRLRGD